MVASRYACWLEYIVATTIVSFGIASILSIQNIPLFSDDSWRYFEGVESILANGKYIVSGKSQLHYPPGLSAITAMVASIFNVEIREVIIPLNIFSYVLGSLFFFKVTSLLVESKITQLLIFSAFTLNSAYLAMFDKFWSEPFFFLLLFSFYWCLFSIDDKRIYTKTAVLAILVGSAIFQRYVALFLVPIFGIYLILISRSFGSFLRVSANSLFWFLLFVVLVLLTLEIDVFNNPPRRYEFQSFSASGYLILLQLIAEQFIPHQPFGILSDTVLLTYFVIVPALYLLISIQCKKSKMFNELSSGNTRHYSFLLIFCSIFFYFMLITVSKLFFDHANPLDLRYFSPTIPLFLLAAGISTERIHHYSCNFHNPILFRIRTLVIPVFQLMLLISIVRAVRFIVVFRLLS